METPAAVVLEQPLFLLLQLVSMCSSTCASGSARTLLAARAFIRVGVLGSYTAHDEGGLDTNTKVIRFVDIQYTVLRTIRSRHQQLQRSQITGHRLLYVWQ
jgi:hypothetical protein